MHDLGYNSLANWYTEEELELAGIAGISLSESEKRKRRKNWKKVEKKWKDHNYT